MKIYNVGFLDIHGYEDETQLNIEDYRVTEAGMIELINLILSLKNEMKIKEITYIEFVREEE